MIERLPALILPGLGNSGPEHWQSYWERKDPLCERVHQDDWHTPNCQDWVAHLDHVIGQRTDSVVLVAHSSACALVAHWVAVAPPRHLERVLGAFLVAPSDPDGPNYPSGPVGFGPVPLCSLPFASILIASADDPYIEQHRARRYAEAWGSRFVLLEAAGHINAASGFGPWPEGYALLDSLRVAESIDA
jgi:predicted alpha/beta hydrolase family esterase